MDGWNTTFLLGWPIFRGYVSFRECSSSHFPELDNLIIHTVGGGEPFFTKVYEVEVAQSLWGSILEVKIFWTQLKIRRCYYSREIASKMANSQIFGVLLGGEVGPRQLAGRCEATED